MLTVFVILLAAFVAEVWRSYRPEKVGTPREHLKIGMFGGGDA